ncbi:MAG TPA: DUF2214 family protein [Caulobacteraceae bacterium]|jgi:putative membrane protein
MTLDLVLAVLHHLLAFGLAAIIGAEAMLLRPGVGAKELARLGRLDLAYGVSAGLLLAVGVCRAVFAAKGWEYYQGNPWFWAKMASFLLVGLMSIPPTVAFIRWRRRLGGDTALVLADSEVAPVRTWIRLEAAGLALIVVFAVVMARVS